MRATSKAESLGPHEQPARGVRKRAYLWGALLVPISSVSGLAIPILAGGPEIFINVWRESILADAVFVGLIGAMGAGASNYVTRYRDFLWLSPLCAVGTWLTYTIAWTIATNVPTRESPVLSEYAGTATWVVSSLGWPGIAITAAALPVFWWASEVQDDDGD